MLTVIRPLLVSLLLFVAGCASKPSPAVKLESEDPKYEQTIRELAALNRQAQESLASKNLDRASEAITKGQPLMARLLAVPNPTLPAVEAAADLEDLYGRMLLANRHYGWARLLFQKNLARWTHWRPQTAETARRKKLAEAGIADCDSGMAKSQL